VFVKNHNWLIDCSSLSTGSKGVIDWVGLLDYRIQAQVLHVPFPLDFLGLQCHHDMLDLFMLCQKHV